MCNDPDMCDEYDFSNGIRGKYVRDIFFEVATPLGFTVRVTRTQWNRIITQKHPIMAGRQADVREALEQPCSIRVSRSDESVLLFYAEKCERRWTCAVARQLDGDGFLITAYPTDAIKEGVQIWPT